MTVRAIQTSYKGYRFRSRLEARWAVFFDAMRITWEYEPEGFELPDGTRYLPDFRLQLRPTCPVAGDVYVEVKAGPGSTEADWAKAKALSRAGKNILLVAGVPSPRRHTLCLAPDAASELRKFTCVWVHADGPCLAASASFVMGGLDLTTEADDGGGLSLAVPSRDFVLAADAARSARFEHGESGAWSK